MSIPYPPPHLHIIILGFMECNIGRTCELHPDGCGNDVSESDDHRLRTLLRLRMLIKDELAAYGMKPDGAN